MVSLSQSQLSRRRYVSNREKGSSMSAAQYSLLAAVIFGFVAALQSFRAITRLPITIGRTSIPIWASWAAAVAIILAWLGYSVSHV
jgi:protein-S-isoprenylcysteine O-methyltransferase Ste14